MKLPLKWRTVRIGDLGKVVTGNTPPTIDESNFGGSIPFVTPGDMGRPGLVQTAERTLSTSGSKKARLVPMHSSLVVCIGSTIGKVGLAGRSLATNQQINAVIPGNGIDKRFAFYEISRIAPTIRRLAGTQAVPIISKGDFEDFPATLPPLSEQQKIAEILSSWDEALEKFDALIAAKDRRKKALMHKLLTGQRRLPGFSKSWKKVRFGDLMQSQDRYADFDDDKLYHLVSARRRAVGVFFREALHGRDIKTKVMKKVYAGDFLISRMQVVHGGLGVVPPKCDGFYASDSYEVLVPRNKNQLDSRFIGHLSRLRNFWHRALVCSHGVHIEKMTFVVSDFEKEKFEIPEVAEQIAIADMIDTADAEHRLLHQQRDAIDQQKRGLMQRLLTGQLRVST